MIKNALRENPTKKFSSAELQTLYSKRVTHDRIHCFQQVAWEIDTAITNGNTRVRLFIEGHGYNHYLEEQDNPTADTLYTYNEKVWLIPGERLAIEIDEGEADTVAKMYLTGYWTKFAEGIVT